jgi:hypothetical protein
MVPTSTTRRDIVVARIQWQGRFDASLAWRSDARLEGFADGPRLDYDPDQPRAENGQFGEGGGGPSNGEEDVAGYLDGHAAFLAENPGAHVGAWYDVDAGKWYLDVSHVTTDRAEATRLAKEHNQEAFYDLGKHETVIVKSAAERRIDAAKDPAMSDKPKTPPPGAPRIVFAPGTPPKVIADALNAIAAEAKKAREAARRNDGSPDQPRDENGRFGEGGGGGEVKEDPRAVYEAATSDFNTARTALNVALRDGEISEAAYKSGMQKIKEIHAQAGAKYSITTRPAPAPRSTRGTESREIGGRARDRGEDN